MDTERVRKELMLYYGINEPTDKQVAMFVLYHVLVA